MLTKNIASDYPPTLLLHARNYPLVPLDIVETFEEFLKETGVESELYIVENGHSNQLIWNNPKAVDKIISFLDKYLK